MALEAAFRELCASLQDLRESLIGLRVTIREDKPLKGDVVLIDLLGDAVDDVLGWVEEALTDASAGQQAAEQGLDFQHARRTLTSCQERYLWLSHRFTFEVLRSDRRDGLRHVGRERGREWKVWASGVNAALNDCQQPLFDVSRSLFRCWQELTERIGASTVSVQATNIGQQVIGRREVSREEVT
jgi:hypothetical protein